MHVEAQIVTCHLLIHFSDMPTRTSPYKAEMGKCKRIGKLLSACHLLIAC
jgi:hypothetical protein